MSRRLIKEGWLKGRMADGQFLQRSGDQFIVTLEHPKGQYEQSLKYIGSGYYVPAPKPRKIKAKTEKTLWPQ